eukprot:1155921-Pelagomonas_calceolata.AAC.1
MQKHQSRHPPSRNDSTLPQEKTLRFTIKWGRCCIQDTPKEPEPDYITRRRRIKVHPNQQYSPQTAENRVHQVMARN